MTYEPVSLDHLLAHQTWAIRMARRLVREEDEAEELVQRTWLAALRRPPDSARGARAWIHRVLQNLAHERHRRDTTRERYERESLRESHDEPEASEFASRKEIHALLADRLLALHEPYRQVLTLRYFEDLSSAEIGRRLGVPPGTVRWRLKVGLEQLRAELDRRSKGDRSKWLSALLAFAPPPAGDAGAAPRAREPAVSAGAAPAGWTWLTPSTWVGLTAGLVGAGWFLSRDALRATADGAPALVVAHAPDGTDGTAGTRASAERTLVDTGALQTSSSADASTGLSIVVVDPRGEPVPGAAILVASASGYEQRALTDEAGRTRIEVEPRDVGALDLPATRTHVALRALAPGREASELWHVQPPFDAGHEVRIPVGAEEHVIRGRVVDEDRTPVAGATLTWFDLRSRLAPVTAGDFPGPSYLSTLTDENGVFELGHLAFGNETLFCLAPGFALRDVDVEFHGREAEVLVGMQHGAIVEGVVRWPGGTPAAGVPLTFEPAQKGSEWATGLPQYDQHWHGFTETGRTAADGSFRITGVSPGKRTLWAEKDDLVAGIDLALDNLEVQHWDAELAKHPALRLRLVDAAQHPLVGWIAFLRQVSGESWWIRRRESDGEGRLVIPDCPPGGAFLDVFDASGFGASYLGQRVSPAEQEQVVVIETRDRGVVSGTVLDSLGRPVLAGQLTLYSRRTAISQPLERDDQGRFATHLGPGKYVLVVEIDKAACRLAQFSMAIGESNDLGTLAVPDAGTLRISAGALPTAEGKVSYTLYALFDEQHDGRALEVGRGSFETEELLSLLPGRYSLQVFTGPDVPPRSHAVRIAPYSETRLDLGR